ncbi:unnamed protein product [Ectocarpus fasciculatus]
MPQPRGCPQRHHRTRGIQRPSVQRSGSSLPMVTACSTSRGALLAVARVSHIGASGAVVGHPQRPAACVELVRRRSSAASDSFCTRCRAPKRPAAAPWSTCTISSHRTSRSKQR